MASKTILVLCASVLLVKSISGQCLGTAINSGLGNGLYGMGFTGNGLYGNGLIGSGCGASPGFIIPASSGGGLAVSSASPIAPNGISIASENAIEGALAVAGLLPFLGSVGLEGQLPTAGTAGVSYSCGNGNVGIVGEGFGAGMGYGVGSIYGSGLANAGLANIGLANAGLANIGLANAGRFGFAGCGCNQ